MKTKKQLFKAAMKGPKLEYNVLLQLLDVITDQRNITIACILEEGGKGNEAVRAEMERIYGEEVTELERKEKIYTEQVEQIAKARVEQEKLGVKDG